MFLSDVDIRQEIAEGRLSVYGHGQPEIQPSSIELHLGQQFRWFKEPTDFNDVIDPTLEQQMDFEIVGADGFLLGPQDFALAHTLEAVRIGNTLAAQVDGKSSLARLGLQVHMTSGFIDPGFMGEITLELFNAAPKPILLRPGMLIGQMFVWRLATPAARPYGTLGVDSRYQHQSGATASRPILDDFIRLTRLPEPSRADGSDHAAP